MIYLNGKNSQIGKSLNLIYKKKINYLTRNEIDLLNFDSIDFFFKNNNLEIFINCSAYTDVSKAEFSKKESLTVNFESLDRICFYCKKNNIHLIHFSTDYIFDGKKSLPYCIDDKPNPINHYGKTKLLAEELIKKKLVNYNIFRTSGVFSPFNKNIFLTLIKKYKDLKKIKLVGDQISSPTSAIEIAKFLIYILTNKVYLKKKGIYNLSSSDYLSWYAFGRLVKSIYQLNDFKIFNIKLSEFDSSIKRPYYSSLDMKKTIKDYEYNFPSVKESLIILKKYIK